MLCIVPSLAFAGGPKNTYPEPRGMDDEINNIYHDLKFPVISSGTAQYFTIVSPTFPGRVVQISTTSTVGTGSTNSTSFSAMFNANAVTPRSTSNKFLVIFCGSMEMNTAGQVAYFTIARDGTNLSTSNGLAEVFHDNTGAISAPGCVFYLDAPATTSSITYSLYAKSSNSGAFAVIGDTNQTSYIYVIELSS